MSDRRLCPGVPVNWKTLRILLLCICCLVIPLSTYTCIAWVVLAIDGPVYARVEIGLQIGGAIGFITAFVIRIGVDVVDRAMGSIYTPDRGMVLATQS